ncbi:MAG: aldo/keto reductase [Polyangiaceae bacterium]|nr:aldo/keto reductase [Polyangiaceae bacterium]
MSDFYGSSSEPQNLGVLERAADLGCTFWDTSDAYGPFANEILISKALAGRRERIILATKFGVSRDEAGRWQGIKGSAVVRNSRLADVVAEVARETEATAAQVALAWVLSRDARLAAIPGTRSTERLEENWAAQGVALRAEQLARLESLINQGVAGNRY